MDHPRAGRHYPRSTGEFLAWFGTDEDCLDYLEWLRWPGGFACPKCEHAAGWRLADGRIECGGCGRRTSVTAGTIFDKTRGAGHPPSLERPAAQRPWRTAEISSNSTPVNCIPQ